MPAIQEHHLVGLAQRPEGKTYFGEIMRRLIYATLAKTRPSLSFLAGETNNYADWDGWVEAQIPVQGVGHLHRSLWELGTDENVEQKLRTDYKNAASRTPPHGWNARDVTYVGATLRKMTPTAKQKLREKLKGEFGAPFGAFVIIAADDLVQWIEKIPSVSDWMATEFKLGPNRFGKTLGHSWTAWSQQTSPRVSESLVLAGRDIVPFVSALKPTSGDSVSLQCDSPDEAVAVSYCAIKSLGEADSALLLANALVLTDEERAGQLLDQEVPPESMPIAVLVPPATTQSQRFIAAGYRVIQAFARNEETRGVISFERPTVEEFSKALASTMGVGAPEAESQARACGCSVAVWHIRNLFNRPSQPNLPSWAESTIADLVIPAIFLGGWHSMSQPDRTVIERLSNLEPDQFDARLQSYRHGVNPLLEYIGPDRFIIAPTAAFEFVTRHIARSHIQRFEVTCKEVFSRVLPEIKERWDGKRDELRMRDRRKELSESLLDGLAETLLRIAVLGGQLQARGALGGYASAQSFVDNLVRSLPGLAEDTRVLASLDRQLPYLMEAAPSPFLQALETLIQGRRDDLSKLLADEAGIFGRSFHTGLLWGLEALAWSPEFLPKVGEVLAGLAEIDPGGHLSNRPFSSLCDILLAWHPGTTASPIARVEVLRKILERYPKTGWRAVVELLPGNRRVATTNYRPTWRTLVHRDVRPSGKEIWEAFALYANLALEAAGSDPIRLADLVDAYPNLLPSHRDLIQQRLLAIPLTDTPELEALWRRIHHLIAHHRGFPDAKWALPETTLAQLQRAALRLTPSNLIARHRWLFDDQFPATGHREADYAGQRDELHRLRTEAVRAIISSLDLKGLDELVRSARYPHVVGYVVAEVIQDRQRLLRALDMWRTSPPSSLAAQAASGYKNGADPEWTSALLSYANEQRWSPDEIATALLDYPDKKSTYDLLATLDKAIQTSYWQRRRGFISVEDNDHETFTTAVKQFVAHNRAFDLVDQDWHRLHQLGYRGLLALLDAFIHQLSKPRVARAGGALEHDVQHVFEWLRKQPEAAAADIAKREYALLPLLNSYGDTPSQLSIHQLMQSDAEFFVDVVCDLYRAASARKKPKGAALEHARGRAEAAFDILSSWRLAPGVKDGAVDESALNAWVDKARTLLKERGRKDIGDQQIGKILYHLPADKSGSWPSAALCNLLERIGSDELERGIEVENFNTRGITSRALYEGGAQERALEGKWNRRADALPSKWTRAKALCMRIARDWRSHAEIEDLSAKSDKARRSK